MVDDKFLPSGPKELKFITEQEPWTIYVLENGVKIRVRLNLVSVHDAGFLPNGFPDYRLNITQVMHADFPEDIQAEITARQKAREG